MQWREELAQRLAQAQAELEEARSTVVAIDAQIQKRENDAQTTAAIADRDLADLKHSHEVVVDNGNFQEQKALEKRLDQRRSERTQRLNQLESELGHLRGERIEAGGVQTERELVVEDLRGQLNELDGQPGVSEEQLARARALETRLTELEAERDELAKRINEYAPVVEAHREATTASGADELAEAYAERAAEHSEEWKSWLKRLVLAGILALVGGVVVILAMHPDKDATNAEIVSAVAVDLLVLGLLLYAVRFAAHQFSVHRHLEAVAQGKAAALRTFSRIVSGPGEAEVRAAVSVALAQAVFEAGATGFVDGTNDNITLVERALSPVAQRLTG